MKPLFERIGLWATRRRRARRFGIAFRRSRGLALPERFFIDGHPVKLECGDEAGHLLWQVGEILIDDCYGLEIVPRAEVVSDIGANKGLFLLAVRGWFGDATVHGYEPNPAIRRLFETNYGRLGGRAFCEAVGVDYGWCVVDQPEGRPTGWARTRSVERNGAVPVVPLAAAVERIGGKVDIMKMDIEGGE